MLSHKATCLLMGLCHPELISANFADFEDPLRPDIVILIPAMLMSTEAHCFFSAHARGPLGKFPGGGGHKTRFIQASGATHRARYDMM